MLKEQYGFKTVVMIGDGATDLEACPPAVSVYVVLSVAYNSFHIPVSHLYNSFFCTLRILETSLIAALLLLRALLLDLVGTSSDSRLRNGARGT